MADCVLSGTDLQGNCLEANCSFFDRAVKVCLYVPVDKRQAAIKDTRILKLDPDPEEEK